MRSEVVSPLSGRHIPYPPYYRRLSLPPHVYLPTLLHVEISRSSFTWTTTRPLGTCCTPSIIRSDRCVKEEYTSPMPLPSFGQAAYQLPFAALVLRGFKHRFTFVFHRSIWLALTAWGVSGIGTLPRMLQNLHFLGVSPRDCHGRSEFAAHSGIPTKSFTPSHPLRTTRAGFPARGSSREFQSRRRVSFHLSALPHLSYLNQDDMEAIALVASMAGCLYVIACCISI